ncbi:MAG TPA: threonine synthase [Nevskiaceae bacterium]|nr:threonine synthase [Nevskiaceae bacterium]
MTDSQTGRYTGLIDRYRERLPLNADAVPVSLCEGNTPLIRLNNIPRTVGFSGEIYVKYEGLNPTGSFKDRGMTVAVTQAVDSGSHAVICASTGNTSASAAAYAARAGIRAFVLIPGGKVAMGKLAQAIAYGATVVQIDGNFDDAMTLVKQLGQTAPVTIVNSINPYRLQGQKTAAFEIIEALGRPPDYHCLPVGNAGNITAHWIGYTEAAGRTTDACLFCNNECTFTQAGNSWHPPKMVGYQASGSAPFMRGGKVEKPETVATAIRIGDPQSWKPAWTVQRESEGWFDECTDDEILAAQRLLASREGVFCEPASAASIAGALRDIQRGKIEQGSTVVCTLTGNGLKDPDVILKTGAPKLHQVPADLATIEKLLMSKLDA